MNEHMIKLKDMVRNGVPFEVAYSNAWKEMRTEENSVRRRNGKFVEKIEEQPKTKLIGKAVPINKMMKMGMTEEQIAEILQLKVSGLKKIIAKFELPQDV